MKRDVKEHDELTNRTKLIFACNVSLATMPFHAKLSIWAWHVHHWMKILEHESGRGLWKHLSLLTISFFSKIYFLYLVILHCLFAVGSFCATLRKCRCGNVNKEIKISQKNLSLLRRKFIKAVIDWSWWFSRIVLRNACLDLYIQQDCYTGRNLSLDAKMTSNFP